MARSVCVVPTNYDSLRGDGLDFLVLDKYALIAREAWPEVLRPALADKQGRCLFIGTPLRYNHFYDLYQDSQNKSQWATFQFTTEDGSNVAAGELVSATNMSSTNEPTGRSSRPKLREPDDGHGLLHVRPGRQCSADGLTILAATVQGHSISASIRCAPSSERRVWRERWHILDENDHFQIRDSLAACEEFLSRTAEWVRISNLPHQSVDLRGWHGRLPSDVGVPNGLADRSGNSSPGIATASTIPSRFAHPTRRSKIRLNCVNAMLRNQADGDDCSIDPGLQAAHQDFERVRWKSDPNGNLLGDIDKSDPMRSHASDALGYMIAREFPMRASVGERSGVLQ